MTNHKRQIAALATALAGLGCLLASVAGVLAAGGGTAYRLVRLAVPGAASTTAYAMNDATNVVGEYRDANNLRYGFFYNSAAGKYTALGQGMLPEGINQLDAFVGTSAAAGRGVYWSGPAATPIPLPTLPNRGHTHTAAHAINDAGIIVGASYIPEDPPTTPGFRAIVAWRVANGTVSGPVELPFAPGDLVGRAADLTEEENGVSVVVGESGPTESALPLSWAVTATQTGLAVTGPVEVPGDYFLGRAYGINADQDIVGIAALSEGAAGMPFVQPAGEPMARLPMLPKAISGWATAVNDAGRIVGCQGVLQKGQGMLYRAVLWSSPSTVVDLNTQVTLGRSESLDWAGDINTRGDILARINGNKPCLLIANP